MTVAMANELCDVLDKALADPSLSSLVITGAGNSFCPGADAAEVLELTRRIEAETYPAQPFGGILASVQKATRKIVNSPKPTVAAINGPAAGGGMDIALACDLRVATRSAKFAQSYIKLALPPLNGGAWLLARAVGEGRALRLLLSGETIGPEAAVEMGIVHDLTEETALLGYAIALAQRIGGGDPEIVAFIKSEVRGARASSFEDALARAYAAGVRAADSPAHRRAARDMLSAFDRRGGGID